MQYREHLRSKTGPGLWNGQKKTQNNKKPFYQVRSCSICGKEIKRKNGNLCSSCAKFMKKKLYEDV